MQPYTNGHAKGPDNSHLHSPEVKAKASANRWTLTRNEATVRKMVRQGVKIADIADAFGVSPAAVSEFKRKRGLSFSRQPSVVVTPIERVIAEAPTPATSPVQDAIGIEAMLEREANDAKAVYLEAVSRWDAASAALSAYRAAKARPANA